ncbi:MAG: FtsX-like permease family protein [Bacteriovoracaceae bacterium]|nr:FtsX-like permease family protein [Bacteriovoracaceae bacterium]
MLIFKLAYRNIKGAGIRTWLNVVVLSLAFVLIIFSQGMIDGMNEQIITTMQDTEIGGGQYWHHLFDPYDQFTIEDGHGELPVKLQELVNKRLATPMLWVPGSIFPDRRVQAVVLKGIDVDQTIIQLPSDKLKINDKNIIPALIGTRMAKQTKLKIGDFVTARWRDKDGTFDATDVKIVHIMSTLAPRMDSQQIWLPISTLRQMIDGKGHATVLTLKKDIGPVPIVDKWIHRDLNYLLKEIRALIKSKRVSTLIFYGILFGMGLLAIFDTQVLAIFHRKKEIGTLMALGMGRWSVISLFTLEGSLHGVLAYLLGAIYGVPLLVYTSTTGIPLPEITDEMGIAMGSTLYTRYGIPVLLATMLILFLTVVFISFLPTKSIVKLKPTDALRGKMA